MQFSDAPRRENRYREFRFAEESFIPNPPVYKFGTGYEADLFAEPQLHPQPAS